MAQATSRDMIWILALNRGIRKSEAVKPKSIAREIDVTERTVRDCLSTIASHGFLRRRRRGREVDYVPPDDITAIPEE